MKKLVYFSTLLVMMFIVSACSDNTPSGALKSYTTAYMNGDFEKVTEEFDKFACRMIQHELDHLDGKMFVDRVAPIRRKMISKKLMNISHGKISAHYKTRLD